MDTRALEIKRFGQAFILVGIFGLMISVPMLAWSELAPVLRHYPGEAPLKDLSASIQAHSSSPGFIRPLLCVAAASCFWLIAGIGVIRLKNWARWLTLMAAAAWVLFWGVAFCMEPKLAWHCLLILGWGGLILWYFLRPSVRAQFIQRRERSMR